MKAEEDDVQNNTFDENLDLNEIQIERKDILKSEILIFEKEVFSQIALENLFNEQLRLKSHTHFFNNGKKIALKIQEQFTKENMNNVALVILEENMPGMSGTKLIKWT